MKRFFLYSFFLLWIVYTRQATAQDSTIHSKKGSYKLREAADNLKESLGSNNEEATAEGYIDLSKKLMDENDYVRAEDYLKKALEIYTRLNKKKEAAKTSRKLAKLQESQNKITPAIKSYESAAKISKDKFLELANNNDARRLRNQNPATQMDYARSNAELFEERGEKEEVADAYRQIAEKQWQQNKTDEAVASFQKAIEVATRPEEELKLNKEIAKVYAADNQIDKAISINKDILNDVRKQNNVSQQIDQMMDLAMLHAKNKQSIEEEALLKEAYRLALTSRNTLKAKECLVALVKYYNNKGEQEIAFSLYTTFIDSLDSLVKTDSSLIDSRLFGITEGRIKELEQEKALQTELMERKNRFNYVLAGSVIAMLILLAFIIKSLYAIKVKNKRIALQSLRREMNPHFIFNSLNSVNQYIAENNELEANKYLTAYSALMRNVMEHSNKDFITLSHEIKQLQQYLALEHLRFQDKFDYTITVEETIDRDMLMAPNMLIQPHLENAIWHGLRYKEQRGTLLLSFTIKEGSRIQVLIKDDGVGFIKSSALKTTHQKAHQSRGIGNTTERIKLLNDLYKTGIEMTMQECQEADDSGTCVTILFPLINKH